MVKKEQTIGRLDLSYSEKTELEEYQEFVRKTTSRPIHDLSEELELLWAAGELNAEAGEVMGEAIKIVRKGENGISEERFLKIIDELGDVLWGCAAVANAIGVSLDDVIAHNIDKLVKRENAAINQ